MRVRTVAALPTLAAAFVCVITAGLASAAVQEGAPPRQELDSMFATFVPPAGTAVVQGETEECQSCHADALTQFNRTYHATGEQSCYACHQGDAVTAHMQGQLDGEDIPGPSLEALSVEDSNAMCLGCHENQHDGSQATWEGSAHSRRDLKCTDCHAVHSFKSERNQLKTASASETCSECHANARAQMLRTSHHPVREGLMGCESCHNPHDGSTPGMIKADFVNELCLQCHQEKRGPFLWEHAPVRENCLNCHNPHGSQHDKMLVAKSPYLCQRCHLNTRHPGTLYDGRNAGTTLAGASNRAIEHACKNCHQSIHGGNAPSGPYLGR